jgi:hypothetical protein
MEFEFFDENGFPVYKRGEIIAEIGRIEEDSIITDTIYKIDDGTYIYETYTDFEYNGKGFFRRQLRFCDSAERLIKRLKDLAGDYDLVIDLFNQALINDEELMYTLESLYAPSE